MREKINSYIGFAKRSRALVSGYTGCVSSMEKGKICLLILASDTAESSAEKILRAAAKSGTPLRIYGTKDKLSEMAGENERAVFGITNDNLAKAILQEIDQDGQTALVQDDRNV